MGAEMSRNISQPGLPGARPTKNSTRTYRSKFENAGPPVPKFKLEKATVPKFNFEKAKVPTESSIIDTGTRTNAGDGPTHPNAGDGPTRPNAGDGPTHPNEGAGPRHPNTLPQQTPKSSGRTYDVSVPAYNNTYECVAYTPRAGGVGNRNELVLACTLKMQSQHNNGVQQQVDDEN